MPLPYLYRPLAYYKGAVLKCAGIATENSRKIVAERSRVPNDGYLAGFIELPAYAGDRIHANTHEVFEG